MTSEELLKAYAKGERDFRGSYLRGADLGGAYLREADLRGSYLRGAYLRGAYLREADLRAADLGGAYLGGADLREADLRGAYLGGAYLGGADLGGQWVVQGAARLDGYFFFLMNLKSNGGPRVVAGCRNFTIDDAKAHWRSTRNGTQLGDESQYIIDSMIELAKIRKLSFEAIP